MSSVMTAGYVFCGVGQPFSLSFTCSGPSCSDIQQMPNVSCITAADGTLVCSNNIACAASSNFSSTFLLTQTGTTIVDARQIIVAGSIVAQTDTIVPNPSATDSPTAAVLAVRSTTSHAHRRYAAAPMLVVLLLWVFGMLVPCAFAEPLHARGFAERQIDNPVNQVISDIFTSTSPSLHISNLFQQVAQKLCNGAVTSLLQTLSGPATGQFIQTMTADLVDDCIAALPEILVVETVTLDLPLELLTIFAGSIMCKTLVNTIISLPFDPVTSVACEAVANISSSAPISSISSSISSSTTSSISSSISSSTTSSISSSTSTVSSPPSACNCLAPTCLCPFDNGLPPHCGADRGDPSCGICAC